MLRTKIPYGAINEDLVQYIEIRLNKYFAKDKYGFWEISEDDFATLKKRGYVEYGRNDPTIEPV